MITVVISIVSFLFLSISNEIEYNSLIINRNDYYFNEVTMALKYNETPGTITQKPGVPWGKVVWN